MPIKGNFSSRSYGNGLGVLLCVRGIVLPFQVGYSETSADEDSEGDQWISGFIEDVNGKQIGFYVAHTQTFMLDHMQILLLATGVKKSLSEFAIYDATLCYAMLFYTSAGVSYRCGLGQVAESALEGVDMKEQQLLLG